MIVLDTNVLSEILKPAPSEAVLGWIASQSRSSVFTTTITLGEILYGIERLPGGRRRSQLASSVAAIFADQFAGRILPFDEDAARSFALILASRRRAGRPMSNADAMIAAIVRSHGASLSTRNIADFEDCGIDLINPWRK